MARAKRQSECVERPAARGLHGFRIALGRGSIHHSKSVFSPMTRFLWLLCCAGAFSCHLLSPTDCSGQIQSLPLLHESQQPSKTDWLINPTSFRAGVFRTSSPDEIALDNKLIRRTFRLAPNGATVAFDNLVTGESMLRGVKPEAILTIDGKRFGGWRPERATQLCLPAYRLARKHGYRSVGDAVHRLLGG